jgi:hypothetical protein
MSRWLQSSRPTKERASECCRESAVRRVVCSQHRDRNVRLQALTLDEVCTSLGILDDVGIVKVEGKRDMLKRTVRPRAFAMRGAGWGVAAAAQWCHLLEKSVAFANIA